jgi:hypothetical protein
MRQTQDKVYLQEGNDKAEKSGDAPESWLQKNARTYF